MDVGHLGINKICETVQEAMLRDNMKLSNGEVGDFEGGYIIKASPMAVVPSRTLMGGSAKMSGWIGRRKVTGNYTIPRVI